MFLNRSLYANYYRTIIRPKQDTNSIMRDRLSVCIGRN